MLNEKKNNYDLTCMIVILQLSLRCQLKQALNENLESKRNDFVHQS